jgi:hypothetical protein
MAESNKSNKGIPSVVWWTTLIVTVAGVIIDKLFEVIVKSLNKSSFSTLRKLFTADQPDYFPLLYILIVFAATLFTVLLYSYLRDRLPSNWIVSGIIVGIVLFFISDLPALFQIGFITKLPSDLIRLMSTASLGSDIAKGMVLTYTYSKLTKQ